MCKRNLYLCSGVRSRLSIDHKSRTHTVENRRENPKEENKTKDSIDLCPPLQITSVRIKVLTRCGNTYGNNLSQAVILSCPLLLFSIQYPLFLLPYLSSFLAATSSFSEHQPHGPVSRRYHLVSLSAIAGDSRVKRRDHVQFSGISLLFPCDSLVVTFPPFSGCFTSFSLVQTIFPILFSICFHHCVLDW